MLGRVSAACLKRCRKVSDGKEVVAIVHENAGGASLNQSCVHMLMEGFSKVPLRMQVPDHPIIQSWIINKRIRQREKRTPFRKSMASSIKSFPLRQIDTVLVDMLMFGGKYLRSFFEYGVVEFPLNPIPSSTTKFFWDDL